MVGKPEDVVGLFSLKVVVLPIKLPPLMRTTVEENIRQARWIAGRLNRCEGEVRFLLPLGGVSALDAPNQPFWYPEADAALFDTLMAELELTEHRKLLPVSYHINDPRFAQAAADEFLAISR